MVKVKPCPHVHAVGALVHQAAQARPLKARFVGGLGGVSTWLKPSSRAGGWASAAPHARPAGRACLSINNLQNPEKPVYHEGVGLLGGRNACPAPPVL